MRERTKKKEKLRVCVRFFLVKVWGRRSSVRLGGGLSLDFGGGFDHCFGFVLRNGGLWGSQLLREDQVHVANTNPDNTHEQLDSRRLVHGGGGLGFLLGGDDVFVGV